MRKRRVRYTEENGTEYRTRTKEMRAAVTIRMYMRVHIHIHTYTYIVRTIVISGRSALYSWGYIKEYMNSLREKMPTKKMDEWKRGKGPYR